MSVIIPTYKRPELLKRCLDAVLRQDLPEEYEVIVVDDEASEATREAVEMRRAVASRELRYLATAGRKGPATARNIGARAARASILAFTDDDCIPDRSWLSNGLAAFREGVAAVSGRTVVPLPLEPTDFAVTLKGGLEAAEFVTANCFCMRDAFEEVHGFDERFEMAWREDSDLQFNLLEKGRAVIRASSAVVVHPVREAAWGVSVKEQHKSLYNALIFKKHPGLYRQKLQARPPLRYYAAFSALLLAVAGLLAGRSRWFGLGAGLWLLQTALLTANRLRSTTPKWGHVAEMAATSAVIPPLSIYWRLRGAIRYRVFFL